MKKEYFQKKIAQLYIDVSEVKRQVKEQLKINKFEENMKEKFSCLEDFEKKVFNEEINSFLINVSNKKDKFLKDYIFKDIELYLEEKSKEYLKITHDYIEENPDFYDSFISITPVWEDDYKNLKNLIYNLQNDIPHIKVIKDNIFSDNGNSVNYGVFEIVTDIQSAFKISKKIEGNYNAFFKVQFFAIDPAFIPSFDLKDIKNSNKLTNNKIDHYIENKVIASLTKGYLKGHEKPVNIIKIFLNDELINNLNYHYINNQNSKKIKITQVAKDFLNKY